MRQSKLSRIGNSAGVIIPKKALDETGLKIGMQVLVSVDPETNSIVIKRLKPRRQALIDPNFAKRVEDFIIKYKPALSELAR